MFRIEKLNSELSHKVTSKLHGSFIKVVDKNDSKNFCIFGENTEELINSIKSMKVYEDDIWIITNPKCGTTWTVELIWLLANDLNYEKATQIPGIQRVPFLECDAIFANISLNMQCIENAEKMLRPRILKTHLPAFMLPDELWTVKPKIIYTIRNPKDAAVSWFHHYVHLQGWVEANIELFIKAFVNDEMLYSPFNEHVLKFWEDREKLNILFLHFEDMKRDLKSVAQKAAKFLGRSYTEEEYEKLCENLFFDNMKKNPAGSQTGIVNHARKLQGLSESNWTFLRKGKVGSYKEELTPELDELLDGYVKKIDYEKTGFCYKFE